MFPHVPTGAPTGSHGSSQGFPRELPCVSTGSHGYPRGLSREAVHNMYTRRYVRARLEQAMHLYVPGYYVRELTRQDTFRWPCLLCKYFRCCCWMVYGLVHRQFFNDPRPNSQSDEKKGGTHLSPTSTPDLRPPLISFRF